MTANIKLSTVVLPIKDYKMSFKPQKGKAYENLPQKALNTFDDDLWVVSTKYDGNQIFITKLNDKVSMYTSDWKEFHIATVAEEVRNLEGNFIVIGEFMQGCEGKLGDRVHSAVLTTYRTNFSKGLSNSSAIEAKANIKVFDLLFYSDYAPVPLITPKYIDRLRKAVYRFEDCKYLSTIDHNILSGREAKDYAKLLVKQGWEGAMCVEPSSMYEVGKRVNHSVKLKYRKTADLLCIDIVPGEGKYEGQIGALLLKDSQGRLVSVGSGLYDYQRHLSAEAFLNKVAEIEYEQIIDTYIQPVFLCIREDKEID
jgi:ATP-dependent DNA ligase